MPVEPLTGLIVYGPLGLWALAATGAVVHLYRDHGRVRDLHTTGLAELNDAFADKLEALSKEASEKANAAATAFAAQVQAMSAAHAQALREQADRYDRQMTEMQNRTFQTVVALSDKMSALADAITRNRTPR